MSMPSPAPSGAPIDRLLGGLRDVLSGRKVRRRSRGESWFHIEITPDITLNVRGDYSQDELALFEQIADHMRQILLEDS